MSWQNSVCFYGGVVASPDVNTLVCPHSNAHSSAIDSFYESTSATLTRIGPDYFTTFGDQVSGLLLVGLISATENYFRDVISFILDVCPTSRARSAEEKVQLGSLLWSKDILKNRSALEFTAFSSAENIKKTLEKFTGIKIRDTSDFSKMLDEYDKLCELRHAVVHSGYLVAGKNAIRLGLRETTTALRINFGYAEIQAAGSICTALIQASNNDLFEELVKRWATTWRNSPSWDPSKERVVLEAIQKFFASQRDTRNRSIPNPLSIDDLLTKLKAHYSLP